MPEDGGLEEYILSSLLSNFLSSSHPNPSSLAVEDVLARAETSLLKDQDLEGAVLEMSQLDGWSGFVVYSWLEDARRYLEIRQAMQVVQIHLGLKQLGAV